MYNRGKFNRTPFNRSLVIETYLSVLIETSTEIKSRLNLEIPLLIFVDTETGFSTDLIREYDINALVESATEIFTDYLRERIIKSNIDTSTEVKVSVTHNHVDEFKFDGDFKPGDRIVIDCKKKTVTINGQNALHLTDGEFITLVLGLNKLQYTDIESERSVLTRITHRDKFLY